MITWSHSPTSEELWYQYEYMTVHNNIPMGGMLVLWNTCSFSIFHYNITMGNSIISNLLMSVLTIHEYTWCDGSDIYISSNAPVFSLAAFSTRCIGADEVVECSGLGVDWGSSGWTANITPWSQTIDVVVTNAIEWATRVTL